MTLINEIKILIIDDQTIFLNILHIITVYMFYNNIKILYNLVLNCIRIIPLYGNNNYGF